MKLRSTWIILCAVVCAGTAWACRYSVRDTGFVDLGDEHYRLVLAGPNLEGKENLYRQIAAGSLLDANIAFEVREGRTEEDAKLFLEGTDGRNLVLATGDELPSEATDATTLIESIAASPLRAQIHQAALDSFAVVLLIEGGPQSEVDRVRASLQAAIREVTRLMPSMPKPVETPPALIEVTAEQLARERVTIWGLGFDPRPVNEPRVAVLFGRGRRIGDPLEGPLITQTTVQERLVIIGQDCECELDRAWMKGPLLPARWDADRQRQAVAKLDFDPENPMVRAEVSRIILRGPGEGNRRYQKLAGTASTLGYSEVSIDELPSADTVSVEADSLSSETATEPVAEPKPVLATETPLERPKQLIWFVIVGGAGLVVLLALWQWRKIRREQG